MTTTSAPSEPALAKNARDPSYEFGRREAEVVARFPSGKRVAVVRGRDRAYPGLRSVAPSTLAFYEAFAPLIRGKHVLDAGSGAGVGTRVLCDYAPHVTALDSDARALEFGREYAPNAEFLQADLCHGSPVDRADAAFLVDVLGHLARPEVRPARLCARACPLARSCSSRSPRPMPRSACCPRRARPSRKPPSPACCFAPASTSKKSRSPAQTSSRSWRCARPTLRSTPWSKASTKPLATNSAPRAPSSLAPGRAPAATSSWKPRSAKPMPRSQRTTAMAPCAATSKPTSSPPATAAPSRD